MKFLIVLSICVAVAMGTPLDTLFKEKQIGTENRVINGIPAVENQFPHQVSLLGIRTMQDIVECAGVLISPRWVLTAAQCTKGYVVSYVSLGAVDLNQAHTTRETRTLFAHENYTTSYLNNDIGLIDLEVDVQITDSVNVVRLLGKESVSNMFVGEPAQISGYGKLNTTDSYVQTTLYYGNVSVISNEECTEFFGRKAVTDATICTKGPRTGEYNMCRGDQGGPLTGWNANGETVLLGLASFGNSKACDTDFPTAYIRPDHYIDWINRITGLDF